MTRLVEVVNFSQWRNEARRLLSDGVPPDAVQWRRHDEGDLFGSALLEQDDAQDGSGDEKHMSGIARHSPVLANGNADDRAEAVQVSRELMSLLQQAACFRADDRWSFLYKVMWRWVLGEHDVASAADVDGSRLHAMAKAVHREEHKMHAYLRFRERAETEGPPRFVAWFEPAHDVLPQVAGHFARRMGYASWMIGTPQGTMLWDGRKLHAGPPVMRGAADIDDDGEALWLTYYRSTFNPARLNAKAMQGHIPLRYWKNLPEGKLVPGLISNAATGARQTGQAQEVGARSGTTIAVTPERAVPEREEPSTLDQCRRCELWRNATQGVPGTGPENSRIMLVGEQPGDQEDLAGMPFIGPAGQLLDRALQQAALERRDVYVTNAVKHFKWEPQGKRRLHKTPGQREINACRYWLEQEIATVRPQIIVALGSTALKSVLQDAKASLTERLGAPFQKDGVWIVAVYHPSYVLRVPGEDAKARAFAAMVDGLKAARQLAA